MNSQNKKKILFLIHSLEPGGAERTVSYLANFGIKQNVEVIVVIYGNRGFYPLDENIKLYELPFNKKRSKNPLLRIKFFLKRRKLITDIVKNEKPNASVALLYPSLFYLLYLKKYTKVFGSERSNPSFLKNPIKKAIRNLLFKKCDGVIFQTKKVQEFYSSLKIKNSIVIQNAAGNEFAYSFDPSTISERKKVISAVGTLKEEKDYITLLKAFKIVNQSYPDYKLVIFGDGPDKQKIIDFSKEIGIEKYLDLPGSSSSSLENISSSSCYVLSSISEGMPNSLIEAMSVGLPSVSTDCDFGPSEIIKDGYNGLLVPVGDYDKMAAAIIKVISNRDFSKLLSYNARKIIDTNSIDVTGYKYYRFMELL